MYDLKALFEEQTRGRYTVLDELGMGGMATVYLIRDHRLHVDRALKVMNLAIAQAPKAAELRSRFTREAIAMANLRHPNIVNVYDTEELLFEPEGFAPIKIPYIVMEFINGGSLRDYLMIAGEAIDPRFAIEKIMFPMLDALHYAHSFRPSPVIHRDIKPENFLIDMGVLKLADFGIAHAKLTQTQDLTKASGMFGSLFYMAPEQYGSPLAADGRSDLYSAGMIFWEMLGGKKPSEPLLGTRFVREPGLLGEVGEHFHPILQKFLARKPEKRYQTVYDAKKALEATLEELPKSTIKSPALTIFAKHRKDPVGEVVQTPVPISSLTDLTRAGERPPPLPKKPKKKPDPVDPSEFQDFESNSTFGLEDEDDLLVLRRRARNRRLSALALLIAATVAGSWLFWPEENEVMNEQEVISVTGPEPEPEPIIEPEPDPIPEPEPVVVKIEQPTPEPVKEPELIKQTAPEPDPVVEPDPIPEPILEPEPDPIPEPEPIIQTAAVLLSGDATGAWLVSTSGEFKLPSDVPMGTYDLQAAFEGGERASVGSATISGADPVSIKCFSAFVNCKVN